MTIHWEQLDLITKKEDFFPVKDNIKQIVDKVFNIIMVLKGVIEDEDVTLYIITTKVVDSESIDRLSKR